MGQVINNPNLISRKHFTRAIENRQEAYKEDVAREKRNYGQVRPREFQIGSTKTWASYSKQRFSSREFSSNYDRIDWNSD